MEQEMTMSKGADPAPGKPITVTVHAHPPGSKHPFTQSWTEGDGVKHQGEIDCKKGSGSRTITFALDDQSLSDLSFAGMAVPAKPGSPAKPGDPRKAMYVAVGGCPNVEGDGGQIKFGKPPSKCELMVVNLNDEACMLYYQLNFIDSQGGAQPFDPIINNGGTSFS